MKNLAALVTSVLLLPTASHAAAARLLSPASGETVPLLDAAKKAFLALPREDRVAAMRDEDARAALARAGHWPLPVRLAWAPAPDWAGLHPVYAVEVRRLPDDTPVFFAETAETSASVDNLEIAATYEWTVRATVLGGHSAPATGVFRTEDAAPRLLRAPGVPNVRDFGGRPGLGGRRVRQGLVYRSAGLNENAADGRFARDEVLAAAPDGGAALLTREKALEEDAARFRALRRDPSGLVRLSVPLSRTWTVYRPSEAAFREGGDAALRALAAAAELPDALLGAPVERIEADADGRIAFDGFTRENAPGPAVFVQTLEADRDGWLALGCGADWFWDLRVDGEVVLDHSDPDGNCRFPPSADNRVFPVRLHAGRNVLAAVVRAGGSGWVWCCAEKPDAPDGEILACKIENDGRRAKYLFYVPGTVSPGPSRVDGEGAAAAWLGSFGVRTELDLRTEGECRGMTGSPLGDGVRWARISSAAYEGLQSEWGREAFARAFRLFLDPENYPIVFHCIAGADRTGSLAFVLGALLGVDEEELRRDWEATAFWNEDREFVHETRFDRLWAGFDDRPGATIRERVENWVLSLGFAPADLDAFRAILLEDP